MDKDDECIFLMQKLKKKLTEVVYTDCVVSNFELKPNVYSNIYNFSADTEEDLVTCI